MIPLTNADPYPPMKKLSSTGMLFPNLSLLKTKKLVTTLKSKRTVSVSRKLVRLKSSSKKRKPASVLNNNKLS